MCWKKWSYWLRGGIIGGIIAIFIYLLYQFGSKVMLSSLLNPYPNVPTFIKWLSVKTFFFLIPFGFGTGIVYRISQFIILLILGFLIGALIGWIYAKIKLSSKQKNKR